MPENKIESVGEQKNPILFSALPYFFLKIVLGKKMFHAIGQMAKGMDAEYPHFVTNI